MHNADPWLAAVEPLVDFLPSWLEKLNWDIIHLQKM